MGRDFCNLTISQFNEKNRIERNRLLNCSKLQRFVYCKMFVKKKKKEEEIIIIIINVFITRALKAKGKRKKEEEEEEEKKENEFNA